MGHRPLVKFLCLKCLQEKGSAKFRHSPNNTTGKNFYCDDCRKIHPKEELLCLGIKTCTNCGEEKARTEFTILKATLHRLCKVCEAPTLAANPDLLRQYNREKTRARREANPEKVKAQSFKQRQSEGFKKKRKEYQQTPKVKEFNKKRNLEFSKELKDGYVLKTLMYQTGLPVEELKELSGIEHLIETKRNLLKLKRIIKDKKD